MGLEPPGPGKMASSFCDRSFEGANASVRMAPFKLIDDSLTDDGCGDGLL